MQDLTIILSDSATDVNNVRAMEEMCRFLILAQHDCYGYKEQGYEMVQNNERLTSLVSMILASYKDARIQLQHKQITQEQHDQVVLNRAEFTAYQLIATAHSIEGVQLYRSLARDSSFSESEWSQLKQALKVRNAIESSDTSVFFKQLRDPGLDYFFACLMIIFMKDKCNQTAAMFYKHFKPTTPLKLLSDKCGISIDDCIALYRANGHDIVKNAKIEGIDRQTAFGKWRQKHPLLWHDKLRADRLRRDLMQNVDSADQVEIRRQ